MTDVRLVTALAIVLFAQILDTGTFYFGAYVFYSPEQTFDYPDDLTHRSLRFGRIT